MSSKQHKPKGQSEKFIDKARELGADEDESAFEDRLRRIVPKPKNEEKAPDS